MYPKIETIIGVELEIVVAHAATADNRMAAVMGNFDLKEIVGMSSAGVVGDYGKAAVVGSDSVGSGAGAVDESDRIEVIGDHAASWLWWPAETETQLIVVDSIGLLVIGLVSCKGV